MKNNKFIQYSQIPSYNTRTNEIKQSLERYLKKTDIIIKEILENRIENFLFAINNNLYDNFTISNLEEVTDFFKDNILLQDFLLDIIPLLNEYFPQGNYELRYVRDPEIDFLNHLELLIVDDSTDTVKEKVKQLMDMDEEIYQEFYQKYDYSGKIITQVV